MSKIGFDIGTTNVKAVVFDELNQVLQNESIAIKTTYNDKGFAEQNVEEILQAVFTLIHQLNNESVTHISFSSAMHSLILTNKNKHPFTPNMIWADNRAAGIIDQFKQHFDWLSFYQKTGTPIHPMSPFAKLLWFKGIDVLQDDMYIFGIKEYVIFQPTGEFVMDYSMASATGMMNLNRLEWDEEILSFLEINDKQLPSLVDVTTEIQAKDYDFKVVMGASDGCLVNLGSGALHKGQTTLTIGTSGAVRMTVDTPVFDEFGRTFSYYLKKDTYVIGGPVNNGGNVIDWLGSLLYTHKKDLYEAIPTILDTIDIGSSGLIFLPHLFGERAPYWDANLSAQFLHINVNHTKEHFVRAMLEGIFFNLKHVLELLEANGGKSTELFVSGGIVNNASLLQMIADIFNLKVSVIKDIEATALGCVLLIEDKALMDTEKDTYEANYDRYLAYRKAYQSFILESRKLHVA